MIGISQSGETRDTVQAVQLAKELGAHTVAVTNLQGTQLTREAASVVYTRAGMEMGVAATKTFTTQVIVLFLLGLRLAEARGTLAAEEIGSLVAELQGLPGRRWRRSSTRAIRSRRSRSATATRTSSSTSAATSACRSRSRARSS